MTYLQVHPVIVGTIGGSYECADVIPHFERLVVHQLSVLQRVIRLFNSLEQYVFK